MKLYTAKNKGIQRRLAGVAVVTAVALGSIGLAAPAASAATADSQVGADYSLAVGSETATLEEGQTVSYPMVAVEQPGTVHTDAVYDSNYGTITVTAAKGVFHYEVYMKVPATSFTGAFQITDRTSGISGGRDLKFSFSGSTPTSKLKNHLYAGTLTGTAYLAGVPIANTVPNSTQYKYSDF
ncbi:hypothetical protein ACL00Q_04260 [Curtobacterium flaccumfaciens pv. flaccumfaciens]|uniref:hypothetical protein n=1 Tax=Curtobacterium flaccumfaciens TaxID=2035 RepID=UPI0039A0A9C5